MSEPSQKAQDAARKAGNRLHHLSMRYVGALVELVENQPVGLLPQGRPGLGTCRDLIDLILLTRAEINALTILLLRAKVLDHEAVLKQFAHEYEWLTQEKAKYLNVGVTDYGITFDIGPKPKEN